MKKGDGKFKEFIKKAGQHFPEILDVGGKMITGQWGAAIQDVGQILSKNLKNSDPEMSRIATDLMAEMKRDEYSFALEGFKAQVEDRKRASTMFMADGLIQKIFGIIFLIGYGLFSWYIINILINSIEMPQLAMTMITMIWTGTSTKLNTIIDFFFGGSMGKN